MTSAMKVLVFGKNGQVGRELVKVFDREGISFVALGHSECDLNVPGAARQAILTEHPTVIVNAAAYTAVDRAESDAAAAARINSEAPAEMADAAREVGAVLVHFSTDYVFDGTGRTPWREEDATAPLNVYGKTKLAGEQAITASGARHFIFRTSWVYGSHGTNFLLTMLHLGAKQNELRVVHDQVGAPTSSRDLAELCRHVVTVVQHPGAEKLSGIYHASCAGQTSWHGFAEAIFEEARAAGASFRVERVVPVSSQEFPRPARRPAFSVLCNDKLNQHLGFVMPDWRESLRRVFDEIPALPSWEASVAAVVGDRRNR